MAALLFLPHYAEVLEHVVRQAEDEGVIDVECRPDVDPAVVAGQLQAYAASTGRALRCKPEVGRVEVRAGTGRGRGGRGGHPAAQGA
jgi:hypothetical protein